jgi:hypothetical protein
MAEVLNDFFSSALTEPVLPGSREMEVESAEMRAVRFVLRASAAASPDGIRPRLLQELEDEIAEGLTVIFSESYHTRVASKG